MTEVIVEKPRLQNSIEPKYGAFYLNNKVKVHGLVLLVQLSWTVASPSPVNKITVTWIYIIYCSLKWKCTETYFNVNYFTLHYLNLHHFTLVYYTVQLVYVLYYIVTYFPLLFSPALNFTIMCFEKNYFTLAFKNYKIDRRDILRWLSSALYFCLCLMWERGGMLCCFKFSQSGRYFMFSCQFCQS